MTLYIPVDQKQGFSPSGDSELLDQTDCDAEVVPDKGVRRLSDEFITRHLGHLLKCDFCAYHTQKKDLIRDHFGRAHRNVDSELLVCPHSRCGWLSENPRKAWYHKV